MVDNEQAFLEKLVAAFREEAAEHLGEIVGGLLKLEKGGLDKDRQETMEIVYRAAHSMKGAARAVNFSDIESVCQSFESALAAMKIGTYMPAVPHFDTLQQTVDLLQQLLTEPEKVEDLPITEMKKNLARLLEQSKEEPGEPQQIDKAAIAQEQDAAPISPAQEPKAGTATLQEDQSGSVAEKSTTAVVETVRIATGKLGLLFRQTEEMMAIKLYTRQRLEDIRRIVADQAALDAEMAKMANGFQQYLASSAKTNKPGESTQSKALADRVSEFIDWSHDHQQRMRSNINSLFKTVKTDERFFGRMIDEHLADMKKILMLPFSHLLGLFPKMVRDLARAQNKEIHFVMTGSEVEIDRRILEVLKDPLIHLVRNCIDHGIEKADERKQAGKPPQASVTITVALREGNKVEVDVVDDGGGIDRQKVVKAAVKAGFIKENEVGIISEQDELSCVFHSGVTTSPLLTDISGRGLGLAIVKEKVEKIGGTVSLTTKEGVGTSFKLTLPVMMATFRSVFVRVSERIFAVPSIHIRQVLRLGTDVVKTVENRETVSLDGNAVSLVWLADALELPRNGSKKKNGQLMLLDLCVGKTRMAFVVDEIIREAEGLVKGLGKQLVRVRNCSGVTVMGTGDLVPILDVSDLILSAGRSAGRAVTKSSADKGSEVTDTDMSVLVVEDSVTSRMLLKNVLESAGYKVITAVDGMAGWTEVKAGAFNAVVSDIEMPRMNGFELTAKIRADQALSDLPVVLVTSLEAREDREKGIEAGANAYIVKSSFDQNNLLEVLRRLI